MIPEPNSRRTFVKKSLAASIAAAQPTFFAGLVRATGGCEGGTTDGATSAPETTWVFETTYPGTAEQTTAAYQTTWPWTGGETTVPYEWTVAYESTTFPGPTVPQTTIDFTATEPYFTTAPVTSTVIDPNKKYLVCTGAPKNSERAAPTATDHRYMQPLLANSGYRRYKDDTLVATGPNKGDYRELDQVGFTLTGTVTTVLSKKTEDSSGNWVLISSTSTSSRSATESQTVIGNTDKSLTWRAGAAVADDLTDAAGQNAAADNSAVSGGLGFERGTLKAKTAWAGTSGGYTLALAAGVTPVSLGFTVGGTVTTDTMIWGDKSLEWSFEVMTGDELWEYRNSIAGNPPEE